MKLFVAVHMLALALCACTGRDALFHSVRVPYESTRVRRPACAQRTENDLRAR